MSKSSRREGIANVFAKFYEYLFEGEGDHTGGDAKLSVEDDEKEPEQSNSLKEFTIDEIQDAIDRLKKGEARDGNGIRVEQFKNCK